MQFRTRSILQLTIIGFLVVAALLMVALLITARQFDQLTELSQRTASESAAAMRASRRVIEHTGAMERNARQYTVLGDPALLAVYATRRMEFHNALEQLGTLLADEQMGSRISELIQREELAFQRLNTMSEQARSEYEFPPLLETAYRLSRLTTDWVDARVTNLQVQTSNAKETLNIQTALLVLAALGVAALFVTLITRPLRQVERAIRRLGRGAYDTSITIKGPRDLQRLGERLDWLRNRLERLEEQRSAFLRHVSHELKTPLASMQESAALLREGVVGELNGKQREILGILDNNCRRLLELIESLLRHHASSFEALDTMPESVNLPWLIDDVLSVHELDLQRTQIRVYRELEKLTVSGDPERVRVIVDNLISNAVKFSPWEGLLRIRLFREEDGVALEVEDEGPGVAAGDREKIFTAFYRGANQAREQYPGSGLGLAIAREYAVAGGGNLRIMSSTTGACFRAVFPS